MTTLDMTALTPRQRDVLGLIAVGQDGGHSRAILTSLERRGLIVPYTEQRSPLLRITRWEVPVHIHIQWCAWCAEQPDEDEV